MMMEEVNLESLLTETIDLVEKSLKSNNISLSAEIADSLPDVKGDPELLKEVLINLINNSIQASGRMANIKITAGIVEIGTQLIDEDPWKWSDQLGEMGVDAIESIKFCAVPGSLP